MLPEYAENKNLIQSKRLVDNGKPEPEKIAYVKNKSVMFFRVNADEYRKIIKMSGDYAAYEFKFLFKRFGREAVEYRRILSGMGIESDMLFEKKIVFVTNTGEYLFDREQEDMMMGQILFDGKDSISVEEGFVEPDELNEIIRKFFQIDSFSVNQENVYLEIDTVQEEVDDTATLNVIDSSSVSDTITSGT
ncbi:MAG: hypothetical protein U9N85_02395 [Bacteroidota bacterium]|nr:hypothetical protein [Bacteroidota bacterium]